MTGTSGEEIVGEGEKYRCVDSNVDILLSVLKAEEMLQEL